MVHIARGTLVKCDLVCGGDVRLDGRLEGALAALRVEIGPDGYHVGRVHADEVIVAGQVIGSIRARRVVIEPTALVEGDVTHVTLSLAEGAILMGECHAVARVDLDRRVSDLLARIDAEEAELTSQERMSREAQSDLGLVRMVRAAAPARLTMDPWASR